MTAIVGASTRSPSRVSSILQVNRAPVAVAAFESKSATKSPSLIFTAASCVLAECSVHYGWRQDRSSSQPRGMTSTLLSCPPPSITAVSRSSFGKRPPNTSKPPSTKIGSPPGPRKCLRLPCPNRRLWRVRNDGSAGMEYSPSVSVLAYLGCLGSSPLE